MKNDMSKLNIDREHRVMVKRMRRDVSRENIKDHYSPQWQSFIRLMRLQYIGAGSAVGDAQGLSMAEAAKVRALALGEYHSIYVFDHSVVDFIKQTELNEKERKQMYSVALSVVEPYLQSGLVVHMAGEKRSILYTFSPEKSLFKNVEDGVRWENPITGMPVFFCRFCENEPADNGFITISEDEGVVGGRFLGTGEIGAQEWLIFFNLCLYISAFPEYVIDGAPPIKVHGSRENSTTIRASKQLRDVYRDGVMPHMRRGHFRFLRSERYKSKRFQAVYVKPTMVGGKATTVIGEGN